MFWYRAQPLLSTFDTQLEPLLIRIKPSRCLVTCVELNGSDDDSSVSRYQHYYCTENTPYLIVELSEMGKKIADVPFWT